MKSVIPRGIICFKTIEYTGTTTEYKAIATATVPETGRYIPIECGYASRYGSYLYVNGVRIGAVSTTNSLDLNANDVIELQTVTDGQITYNMYYVIFISVGS